ncbi:MAG TPA: hypothetical protein VE868_11735, partial [Balneolaceae bacterium]|nr:hypothetical protein [Balneolaceae bacterium]
MNKEKLIHSHTKSLLIRLIIYHINIAKQISRIFLVILLLMAMITPMAKAQSNVKQPSSIIKLPKNGNKGINFDDLRYFSQLNSVAVPAAQTGDLDLINPKNNNVTVFPSVAE